MDIKNPANIQPSSPVSGDDKNSATDLNAQFMIRTMENDLEALSNKKPPVAPVLPAMAPTVKKPPVMAPAPPLAPAKPVATNSIVPPPRPTTTPLSSQTLKSGAPPVDLPIPSPKPALSPFTRQLTAEILKTETQSKKESPATAAKPAKIELLPVLQEEEIYPPTASNKKMLKIVLIFSGLLILTAAAVGFFVWQKILLPSAPSPSPSASVSQTPALRIDLLPADRERVILYNSQVNEKITDNIFNDFKTNPLSPNSITKILISNTDEAGSSTHYLNLPQIAQEIDSDIFKNLESQLSGQSDLFVWGQTEESTGPAAKVGFRPMFVAELTANTSATAIKETLKQMEPEILTVFSALTGKESPDKKLFLDNIYKDIAIRYINLPDPSLTIDYAIVGRLLLITTSKASMYAAIDRLQNIAQ